MFSKGLAKTAVMKLPVPPKGGAIRSMSAASAVPKRVGAPFQPGSPVKSLRSITGHAAQSTFGKPLKRFGAA
jgi:hypothetical protein